MLIRRRDLEAIVRGDVDLAFRRWRRPTVRPGGSLRTAVGVLAIDSVDAIEEETISEADARRAGFASRRSLLRQLNRRREGELYRIGLRFAGDDPRRQLARDCDLSDDDVDAIDRRLERLDRASPRGPWTAEALRLIAENPATRAADLAAVAGLETHWLKSRVRKLKELGLTESLKVGYRLSPRGRAYLAARRR